MHPAPLSVPESATGRDAHDAHFAPRVHRSGWKRRVRWTASGVAISIMRRRSALNVWFRLMYGEKPPYDLITTAADSAARLSDAVREAAGDLELESDPGRFDSLLASLAREAEMGDV